VVVNKKQRMGTERVYTLSWLVTQP